MTLENTKIAQAAVLSKKNGNGKKNHYLLGIKIHPKLFKLMNRNLFMNTGLYWYCSAQQKQNEKFQFQLQPIFPLFALTLVQYIADTVQSKGKTGLLPNTNHSNS